MRKRFAVPFAIGFVVVVAAGYVVWSNLTGRSLFVGLSVAAGVSPAGGPGAISAAGSSGAARAGGATPAVARVAGTAERSAAGTGTATAGVSAGASASTSASAGNTAGAGGAAGRQTVAEATRRSDAPTSNPPPSTANSGADGAATGNPDSAVAANRNPAGPLTAAGAARRPGGRVQTHPVKTEPVKRGTLETYVKLTGEVEAATRVDAFPEVAGKVDQINVGVGSSVSAQSVLLTVDPSRPGTRYEPSPVRSPISGTVIAIAVSKGQSVSPSTPTVTVATIGNLELSVRVPERYASVVTYRSVARVTFDALGGKSFSAWVKRLQPVIDPISRSKEAVFALSGAVTGIEPGMFASVELVSASVTGAVIVPFEAIVQETDSNYVFVAEEGKAVKRAVEIGLLAGEVVQVRSGLSGGESVITTGQTFLEDGSPISIVATAGRFPSGQAVQ